MIIKAIVAMDRNRVVGFKNTLPWKLPEDLKRVSELTTNNLVIMGRTTYESLPEKYRPLPNRKNIVVSQKGFESTDEIEVWSDLKKAIAMYKEMDSSKILWVFGGQKIYEQTIDDWQEVHLTYVDAEHEGDAYFPIFEDKFDLITTDKRVDKFGKNFEFRVYRKKEI